MSEAGRGCLLVMLATGSVTVGGPPELGVQVTVWRSPVSVRMPSFFLYRVRPAGKAMVRSRHAQRAALLSLSSPVFTLRLTMPSV